MMNDILKYDPDFTEEKFKTFVDNVFIQIHLAVMTKEIENVKHFMSDEIYDKFKTRVDSLKERGLIQMYDETNVKSTSIIDARTEGDEIHIDINIVSRYMDYLMDEDGNFVSGINDARIEKNNYMTFTKRIGASRLTSVSKCPGCGASVDVNSNGKCAYCDTIFNLEDKGWILTSLETR